MLLTISCLNGESLMIDTEDNDSISELKNKIYKLTVIPPVRQRLIYCGKCLPSDGYLSDYNIQNKTSIHLVQAEEMKYWNDIIVEKTKTLQTQYEKLSIKNKELINQNDGLNNVIKKLKENKSYDTSDCSETIEQLTLEKDRLLTANLKFTHQIKENDEVNKDLVAKFELYENQNLDTIEKYKKMIDDYQKQNNNLIKDKQILLERVDKCINKISVLIGEKQELINQTNRSIKQQEKLLDEKQELLQAIDIQIEKPLIIKRKKKKFPRFIGRNYHSSMP